MAWRRYFAFNTLEYPDKMLMAILCKKLKWTYNDYMSSPLWFIHMMTGLISEESKNNKK